MLSPPDWQDDDPDLDDDLDGFDDDDDDDDDDDQTTTDTCPYCKQEIYDDAERCPECGQYLSRLDRPLNRPLWIVLTVVLLLSIIAYGYLG